MIRRILKYFFYLFLLFWLLGTLASLFFVQKNNPNPLPAGYKKGVFHIHSSFSDGTGTWEDITRAAVRSKLDFVIVTDHGRPNRRATISTTWKNNVLLIGSSEFSTLAGHLMAGGYKLPGYVFPPEAQEAVDEVNRDGGVTFVSHPFDRRTPWTDWNANDFTGIEILSLYERSRNASLPRLLLFPSRYLLQSDYALTTLLTYPAKEMATWENLNQSGKYYGIYAIDAHGSFRLFKKHKIGFPSYAALFRILTVYVKLEREWVKNANESALLVWQALKKGCFFNAIESLAPANGFDLYYQERDGTAIPMGASSADANGMFVCQAPFDFPYTIRFYRDGQLYRTEAGDARRVFNIPSSGPGVYRAQVHLAEGSFKKLPWILSNPIFIDREEKQRKHEPVPVPLRSISLEDFFFKVETNRASTAGYSLIRTPAGESVAEFSFLLNREPSGHPDFCTALASRKTHDFSGYRGLVFSAMASERIRFWFWLRAMSGKRELLLQHSFLIEPDWGTVVIPFDKMYCPYNSKTHGFDRSQISSLFFLVDGGISFSGKTGLVRFKSFGLY